MIDQTKLVAYKIQNYFDQNKGGEVIPLRDGSVDDDDIERIVDICSQDRVYSILFKDKFEGKPYGVADAKGFVKWANQGWEDDSHFVFIIRNDEGNLVGTIDIKSNNPEYAEIGYWLDNNSRGYMTNAVIGLVEIAQEAGYQSLCAYTRPLNDASKKVLTTAGFKPDGKEKNAGGIMRDRFIIALV